MPIPRNKAPLSSPPPAAPPALHYPAPFAVPHPPRHVVTPAAGHTQRLVAALAGMLHPPGPVARRTAAILSGSPLTGALSLRLPGGRRYGWAYLAGGIGGLALLVRAALVVTDAAQEGMARLQYGALRVTTATAYFNVPAETPGSPSRLTAVNDAGMGHLYLLLGGQPARSSVVEVAGGDPAGRLPLLLTVADADGDGHADVAVAWGPDSPPLWYLFDTGTRTLRPPTAEEAARLRR